MFYQKVHSLSRFRRPPRGWIGSVRLVETVCYVFLKCVLTLTRNGGFRPRVRSDLKCAFRRDGFACFSKSVLTLTRYAQY